MTDDDSELSSWAKYLNAHTARGTGWTVARLARESAIHRSTIFDWKRQRVGTTQRVTIESVRAIAAALGDSMENALRAAGSLLADDGEAPAATPSPIPSAGPSERSLIDRAAEVVRALDEELIDEDEGAAMLDLLLAMRRRAVADRRAADDGVSPSAVDSV